MVDAPVKILADVEKASKLYLFLFTNGAMTCAQIADRMGIDMTETYNLLSILTHRELLMAMPTCPIKFVARSHQEKRKNWKFLRI